MKSARATLANSAPKQGPNSNSKSGSDKESSSDAEPSGNGATKPGSGTSANGTAPAPAKSDPAQSTKSGPAPAAKSAPAPLAKLDLAPTPLDPAPPGKSDLALVLVATDPTPPPADPPLTLKTAEQPVEQPHSTPMPAAPVEISALPEPVTSSVFVAAQNSATPPTESTQDDTQAPADPGNLVFQLSLNSLEPAQKGQIAPPEQAETAPLLNPMEVPAAPQPQAGASGSDTKNQNQQEQQPPSLPQLPPAATDGTIASQFGFQTPLSFALQTPAQRPESIAAPVSPRMTENVSTPDLPMAPSIDRVGLTIRGADDQVVRVQISQSGELVQVGVHTGNSDLASELRASVPELVHRLDQQGYESRVSMPASSFASLAPAVVSSAHSEFRSGADTSGNTKSNSSAVPQQDEPRQQRQRSPQKTWRELASQLQED